MSKTILHSQPHERCVCVPLALPVSVDFVGGSSNIVKKYWQSQWHPYGALLMGVMVLSGCSHEPVAVVDTTQRVYVDTATQKALMLPVQDKVPAKHPETGKNTLVPALYCPQCGRWYPAPPTEVVQRTGTASRCPQGGHPMSPHGPSPQGS